MAWAHWRGLGEGAQAMTKREEIMSTQLLPRPLRYILVVSALAFSLLLISSQALTTARAAGRQATAGNTYVVNTTADTVDADVGGDPACADASGHCSLRAAIMQANFATGPDTITLPSGLYTLTRPGDDDADQIGDLDILDDLTIQGAGSGTTIIDGNGAVTGDRVLQIFVTARNVNLRGLTIRHGQKISYLGAGGGLYWDGMGSQLRLHDVVVADNAAFYGGGLYLNVYFDLNVYSGNNVVDLDQIIIHANTATYTAGGLSVDLRGYSTFDLRNSRIDSNMARSEAGGLLFAGIPASGQSARIETTEIYSNTAPQEGGFENVRGTAGVPTVILNSRLHNNHADYDGGAIGNYGTLVISNTTIDANSANSGTYSTTTRGGGLYNYPYGQVTINQSTLSGNSAASGGGIYAALGDNSSAALTLTNSTLSGNTASRDGGGLYAAGGQINLLNATIAGNSVAVPMEMVYKGVGGGVYITGTAVVSAHALLLADNTRRYGTSPLQPDDCFGRLISQGYNLIKTITFCTIDGYSFGVISGQSPMLGPLQNNGGSTLTQVPQSGSPAIDQGDNTACPPIDQRGFRRPIGVSCDIGAVEAGPSVYLPLVRR